MHIGTNNDYFVYCCSKAITQKYLCDTMRKDFKAVIYTLPLVLSILKEADKQLFDCLVAVLYIPTYYPDRGLASENANEADGKKGSLSSDYCDYSNVTMFLLCNYITWFTHDIKDPRLSRWVVDLMVTSPKCYILYFCAAVSLKNLLSVIWGCDENYFALRIYVL